MRVLRLCVVISFVVSALDAQENVLSTQAAAAKREQRAAEVRTLIEASSKLSAPVQGPTTRYAFIFSGPTADHDVGRFYAFFAKRYPEALEPVEVRSDLTAKNCKATTEVCETLSHAAFAYGLLARNFPDNFEKGVLDELKERFHTKALPGVSVTWLDLPQRRWLPAYGEKVAKTLDKHVICGEARFDGESCILGRSGDYVFINAQAMQITIHVPISLKDELMAAYLKEVEATHSYKEDWQAFFEVRDVTIHSVQAEPEPPADFDFETADPVLEGTSLPDPCAGTPVDAHFQSREQVARHVTAYRRQAFPDGIPSLSDLRQPTVIFYDRFAAGNRLSDLKIGAGVLGHPDFLDSPPAFTTPPCLDLKPPQVAGHGLFGIGLFAARRNGIGVVGLLPDYDLSRIKAIDIENSLDLLRHLPAALGATFSDGNTAIANISLSVDGSGFGNPLEQFRKLIRGTEKKVLYVASAGNAEMTDPPTPQLWQDACRQVFPCLGDEPNVIIAGALDHARQDRFPALWPLSNYGSQYVTVAAPGASIVSLDHRSGPAGPQFGYSVRSGTSESAVFVTAAAARILADNPGLSPVQIKQWILSRTMPIEVARSNNVQYLFAADGRVGDDDPASVAAGGLVSSDAVGLVPGEATVFVDGQDQPLRGRLRFAPNLGEFVLYKSLSGAPFEVRCPLLGLLRLSRRAPNQYSLYCLNNLMSGNTTTRRLNLFYDSHFLIPEEGESPMSCLYRGPACLTLVRSDNQQRVPIDLRSVRELFINSISN